MAAAQSNAQYAKVVTSWKLRNLKEPRDSVCLSTVYLVSIFFIKEDKSHSE
ncbi:Uncharacterized protein DAT39_008703, partial [Clarias magur]